jgi:hypothetical protein
MPASRRTLLKACGAGMAALPAITSADDVCVPKTRFGNIGDGGRREQVWILWRQWSELTDGREYPG